MKVAERDRFVLQMVDFFIRRKQREIEDWGFFQRKRSKRGVCKVARSLDLPGSVRSGTEEPLTLCRSAQR